MTLRKLYARLYLCGRYHGRCKTGDTGGSGKERWCGRTAHPPYAVYNIGNNHPENLLDFVTILQEELVDAGVLPENYDFESHKELVAMQPGDVPVTYADTSMLEKDFGFKPQTPLREGLRKFAVWYKEFYLDAAAQSDM